MNNLRMSTRPEPHAETKLGVQEEQKFAVNFVQAPKNKIAFPSVLLKKAAMQR